MRHPPAPAIHPLSHVTVTVNTILPDQTEPLYYGEHTILALSDTGVVLDRAHAIISTPTATSADLSKLATIHTALNALIQDFPPNQHKASYKLTINQAANNIHGWFALGYARHSPPIIAATTSIFMLLRRFPEVTWNRHSRATIQEAIQCIDSYPVYSRKG